MAFEPALAFHPRSLGERLFHLLLDALRRPPAPTPAPLRLVLSLGDARGGLALCCDASRDAPSPRDAAPGVRWQQTRGGSAGGPLYDFLLALAGGPARGIVFTAAALPRAVFRGEVAGWAVRLSVRAWSPGEDFTSR